MFRIKLPIRYWGDESTSGVASGIFFIEYVPFAHGKEYPISTNPLLTARKLCGYLLINMKLKYILYSLVNTQY